MIIKEIHDGKNKNNRGKVVPLLKFASQASIHALLIRLLIFSEVIACSCFAIRVRMGHSSGSLRTRIGCY